MTGRTIGDIKAKGYQVRTPHRTQPNLEIRHDEPFFVAYDDGQVEVAEHTGFGYVYDRFVHGDNGFEDGTPVSFDIVSRPELKTLFAGKPDGDVGKTCLAMGKTAQALDEIAAMHRYAVRMGDPHPWREMLDRAPRSDRRSGLGVLRQPGAGGFSRMTNGLLDFGGWTVVNPGREPDLEDILARGQLWPGEEAISVRGQRSQCHANSARHWARNMDDTLLVTGYALSDDGMWRQHTWCVTVGEDGPRIVETTEPRMAYFGFVLTAEEAVQFHEDVLGKTVRLPKPRRPREPELEIAAYGM